MAAVPWTLHSFGYTAGLPTTGVYSASLVFELARRSVVVPVTHEPIGCPGTVIVSDIGPNRKVLSVVADAPAHRKRQWVKSVQVSIAGLRCGAVAFGVKDLVSTERSYSFVLGDPTHFTYDRAERLAVRNAIWNIEDKHLPGELTRRTIPGLPRDLLVESSELQLLSPERTFDEIRLQLAGALRVDTWGYLWKWDAPPSIEDGPTIALSADMTLSMADHLHDVTETVLRACGMKPLVVTSTASVFEPGTDVLDAVAYALVAMRRGVSLDDATFAVLRAVQRYGQHVGLENLGRAARTVSGWSEDPLEQ